MSSSPSRLYVRFPLACTPRHETLTFYKETSITAQHATDVPNNIVLALTALRKICPGLYFSSDRSNILQFYKETSINSGHVTGVPGDHEVVAPQSKICLYFSSDKSNILSRYIDKETVRCQYLACQEYHVQTCQNQHES